MSARRLTLACALVLLAAVDPDVARLDSARWYERGPNLGGRLSAIVTDPADASLLLVSSPGGGVWRSTDGGTSWHQPRNYALADFSVVHLEWDRQRAGRLYASTYSDLYATTDRGDTWTNLTHSGGYPAPPMPLSHPSDPKPFAQLRYSASAGTVFWSKPCQGLSYSSDGVTFTQHWPFAGGAGNTDNCLLSIAADDATGRVYFSTMERLGAAHVYRSTCAWTAAAPCLTWEPANAGLPGDAHVAALAWTGQANKLVAASAVGSATVISLTHDGGLHWAPTPAQPPATSWDPRPLAVPAPGQILVGTVIAYQSTDWGASWSQVWFSGLHPDVRAFHWRGTGKLGRLWLATDGSMSGAYATLGRFNFTPGSAPTGGTTVGVDGLHVWQPYFMAATATPGASRRRIFLGAIDNGALCSDDGGLTWTTSGTPPGGGCGDYMSLVFAPSRADRAYARTCSSASIGRSDNAFSAPTCAGVTWTELSPPGGPYAPQLWTRAMSAVDPTNPDRVAFARNVNVGLSTDGGATFTQHALPDGAQPVSVAFLGGALYAGTLGHGAYQSTDSGATWTAFALNGVDAPKAVMQIARSSAGGGAGTFFLATTSGLYRKLSGATWTRQTPDASYAVSDVEVDPHCATRVYAALGYAGSLGQHRGGVLRSTDNGATFTSITAGLDLHQAPITDVQVDPATPRYVYAAVFGRGAWVYDAGVMPTCP